MSISPDVRKRIDSFVSSSKDVNFVGRLAKSPRLVGFFVKMYNVLSPETKAYVLSCTQKGVKVDFSRFSDDSMVKALPYLEKALKKVNK
jgi:hypothetical protein